jgi:hypothetical protein
MGGYSLKHDPISTEGIDQVCAFKHCADGATWELWIEIPDTVEANQTGNDPMASDLVSEPQPGRIEVSRVTGEPIAVSRIRAEASPPVTAEVENLDQHH